MQALQAFQEQPQELPRQEVSRDQIVKYLDTFGLANELTEQEKSQFIEIAEAYQLNPFKREIYAVPYGEGAYRKLSIITGFEVYLKRSERSGKLDGWRAWCEGDTEDTLKAIVEIHRRDWQHPFTHTVYWREAVQKRKDGSLNQFWRKQPRFMLRKVCISQGFRLCFPEDLAGIPYTSDELPEEMTETSPHESPHVPPQRPEQSAAKTPQPQNGNTTPPETKQVPKKDPRIESLTRNLEEYEECFTENHRGWILSQVQNNPSDENIKKMEAHVQEVIKSKKVTKPLKRMENAAKQREQAASPTPIPEKGEMTLIF